MWEFIDKIVYINLDKRTDRKDSMLQFFNSGHIPDDKIIRFPAIQQEVGIIGCSQSHIGVLRMAKQNNWKNVLILEDDIEWHNFESNYAELKDVMDKNWDVCMLGGVWLETEENKVKLAILAHAYIVRDHYYDTLISNMSEGLTLLVTKPHLSFRKNIYHYLIKTDIIHAPDLYWTRLQQKDNWIKLCDNMCNQKYNYSNNVNSYIDPQNISNDTKQNLAYYIKSHLLQ